MFDCLWVYTHNLGCGCVQRNAIGGSKYIADFLRFAGFGALSFHPK